MRISEAQLQALALGRKKGVKRNRPSGLKYNLKKDNPTWFTKGYTPYNNGTARPHFDKSVGYLRIWNKGKFVKHHRLVVEQELGRKLDPTEIIHHIDGNKLNNDISNLQIMTRSAHMKLHWRQRLYV